MAQDNPIDKVVVKKHYYKSGTLWWETPYVNGEMHGIEKGYYESGALWWEIPYKNGKRHGIARGYDEEKLNIDCIKLYRGNRQVMALCLESPSM